MPVNTQNNTLWCLKCGNVIKIGEMFRWVQGRKFWFCTSCYDKEILNKPD